MKYLLSVLSVTWILLCGNLSLHAEPTEQALIKGSDLGAFYVTKLGGASDDKVDVDDTICYRCKYGSRPQIIVFTRSSDDSIVKLIRHLDELVKSHEQSQLKAFVNVLGDDKNSASDTAKKLASVSMSKLIPLVVPVDHRAGPAAYKLNAKAKLIVMIAKEGKVDSILSLTSSRELDVKQLDDLVAQVVQ
jgi:hypothetical protein